MTQDAVMLTCPICASRFQYGPHRYAGRHIARYKMTVCETCWSANHDGWGPHAEAIVLEHLKKNNLPVPPCNARGWLPRE